MEEGGVYHIEIIYSLQSRWFFADQMLQKQPSQTTARHFECANKGETWKKVKGVGVGVPPPTSDLSMNCQRQL